MTTPVATPPFALPKAVEGDKPSTSLTVYRAPAGKIAERMRELDLVVTQPLGDLVRTKKHVNLITDWWGVPLAAGVVGAIGSAFCVEGLLVPLLVAGGGALTAIASGVVDRFIRPRALANAPSLLEGELREEVLKLGDARTNFEPGEGHALEAKELDVFVARRAQALLASAKHAYYGTNDTELIAVLERYASISTKLTPDEESLLDFVDKCLAATKRNQKTDVIPELFAALPDAQQRELAPFVRDLVFDDDRLKISGELKPFLELHARLEAIEPKAVLPFTTKPTTTPAPLATSTDHAATLRNLASYEELASAVSKLSWGDRDAKPELVQQAVQFAIADDRTGVERYLMGVMAHRMLAHLDHHKISGFRLRLVLQDLVDSADAEPKDVQDAARLLLKRADNIIRGFRDDASYAQNLVRVADLIDLSRP